MNIWGTRILAVAVVCTMMLTGCAKSAETDSTAQTEAAKPKAITLSWAKDIGSLNPHLYAPNELFAQAMVYEPLVQYGVKGDIQPSLAEKWDITPDGKTYTFHLRKGVKYSDGSELDAANVKKNFDALLANGKRHSWLGSINEIKNTEIVDPQTFKIELKNSYYPFLQELSLIRPLRMLGNAGFPDDGSTAQTIKRPIGTGPWVLTDYRKDEQAVFTRNEHYWGEKPKLDKVTIKIIPDPQARAMALEKKEIDMIFGSGQLTPNAFKSLKDTGRYQTLVSDPLSTRVLAVNSNKGPTRELNVRQALEYAFDKKTVIEHVLNGVEKPADTLFSSALPYSNVNLKPYEFNLEKAKSLLDASGWKLADGKPFREKDGKVLELDLAYDSNDQVQKTIFEYMQGEWRKIGIKGNMIGEEKQAFTNRQKEGAFNLAFNETWGIPYDPHTVVASMRESGHADYQAQAGLPMKKEIDDKITQVIISTDEKTRQELYTYILTTLHEQAVYLPISYTVNVAVANNNVSGVSFYPMQFEIPFKAFDIK